MEGKKGDQSGEIERDRPTDLTKQKIPAGQRWLTVSLSTLPGCQAQGALPFTLLCFFFFPQVNARTHLVEDPLPSAEPPLQKKPVTMLSLQCCRGVESGKCGGRCRGSCSGQGRDHHVIKLMGLTPDLSASWSGQRWGPEPTWSPPWYSKEKSTEDVPLAHLCPEVLPGRGKISRPKKSLRNKWKKLVFDLSVAFKCKYNSINSRSVYGAPTMP